MTLRTTVFSMQIRHNCNRINLKMERLLVILVHKIINTYFTAEEKPHDCRIILREEGLKIIVSHKFNKWKRVELSTRSALLYKYLYKFMLLWS